MLNGAFFTASGAGATARYDKASSMAARPPMLLSYMTAGAGALRCNKGNLCHQTASSIDSSQKTINLFKYGTTFWLAKTSIFLVKVLNTISTVTSIPIKGQ